VHRRSADGHSERARGSAHARARGIYGGAAAREIIKSIDGYEYVEVTPLRISRRAY